MIEEAVFLGFFLVLIVIIYFGSRWIMKLSNKGVSSCCKADVFYREALYDSHLEYTGYECSKCKKQCNKI